MIIELNVNALYNSYLDAFNASYKINSENTCWEWTKAVHANGYGLFFNGNTLVGAHRYSYLYYKGKIPKGMLVCHSCDNRKCVNPDHLWLGTFADNMKDKIHKGRQTKGELVHTAKLTEIQAKEIFLSTENVSNLSKLYNVHEDTIKDIKLRRTWKHVTYIL